LNPSILTLIYLPAPPGASAYPTGSAFAFGESGSAFIPVYWNPDRISRGYEEFNYLLTTPTRVTALHAISDVDTAIAYVLEHYDHSGATADDRAQGVGSPEFSNQLPPGSAMEGRVQDTLSDWRKRRIARACGTTGLLVVQCYWVAEVLDAAGRVVSSKRDGEYVPRAVAW
jgi:hypothetical protein